jgi:hypothetical protein
LLYLIPLGFVATAIVVVFFGLGFFLLAHPSEGVTVDPGARDRGVEIEHRRPDPAPSPGKDAAPSTLQTPVRSVFPEKPPEAPDVSPPPRNDTTLGAASGADAVAANATFYASSRQEQPELRSNNGRSRSSHAGRGYPRGRAPQEAPRTGSTANQLNHEELAGLHTK